MRNDLNVVTIAGRIANEPEVKYTANGHPTISLSLANHQWIKKENEEKEETNYFKIRLWGKVAENLAEYLKKGKMIAVNGKLHQYSFESPNGDKISVVEIVASQIFFLTSNGKAIKTK